MKIKKRYLHWLERGLNLTPFIAGCTILSIFIYKNNIHHHFLSIFFFAAIYAILFPIFINSKNRIAACNAIGLTIISLASSYSFNKIFYQIILDRELGDLANDKTPVTWLANLTIGQAILLLSLTTFVTWAAVSIIFSAYIKLTSFGNRNHEASKKKELPTSAPVSLEITILLFELITAFSAIASIFIDENLEKIQSSIDYLNKYSEIIKKGPRDEITIAILYQFPEPRHEIQQLAENWKEIATSTPLVAAGVLIGLKIYDIGHKEAQPYKIEATHQPILNAMKYAFNPIINTINSTIKRFDFQPRY